MRVIVSTLSELCITPGALIVAFAVMYIPRLGFTWNKPVLEGTGTGVLKKGSTLRSSTLCRVIRGTRARAVISP